MCFRSSFTQFCLDGLLVQPTQEITLCIRANRQKAPLKTLSSSNIVLDSAFAKIDPMASPHSQFFKMTAQAAQIAAIKVRHIKKEHRNRTFCILLVLNVLLNLSLLDEDLL